MCIRDRDTSKWVEVEPSETGTTEDGNYFAKYSIKAVTEAYGATDLSDVDAISVKCDNTITLKELSWVGPKAADDGAEILFSGSKTAKGNTSLFTYLYTKHVGGDFDNASIRYGSYFTLEYTGCLLYTSYVYSIGGAILDKENPSIVKYRCKEFLITPEKDYEERGFVPNVCFPCATINDSATGKIAIYYGAADSYVGLAFTTVDEIVAYIKEHSSVGNEETEIGRCV